MSISIGWMRSYTVDERSELVGEILWLSPAQGLLTAQRTAPGQYWLEGELTVNPMLSRWNWDQPLDSMTLYVGVPEPSTATMLTSGVLLLVVGSLRHLYRAKKNAASLVS
jgi:hypothetical protein